MGKAGKRKARQKRKQQARNAVLGDSAPSNNKAVPKLRHPDNKVRHAALMALQNLLSSGSSKGVISLPVLQAIREQTTSSDLECSATAAECLVLYLQGCGEESDSKRTEATATWATVLLGRLEQCLQGIHQTIKDSTKNDKQLTAWWAVVSPCIHALCLLIETNNDALDQVLNQRHKFCAVAIGILRSSLPNQQNAPTTTTTTTTKNASLYAARSLHSALEDNFELAETVLETVLRNDSTMAKCLQLQQESAPYSMVQLHLVGSLVNLYLMVQQNDGDKNMVEDMLLKYAVGTPANVPVAAAVSPMRTDDGTTSPPLLLQKRLFSVLAPGPTDHFTRLLDKYDQAVELYNRQQQDEQIEKEVVQQVQERKEPAREIARRQKKQNAEEDATRKQRSTSDVDMEDAANEPVRGKFDKREQNGEEAMEEALQEWNSAIGPLLLSLEILANLLTNFIPMDEEDQMDMDGDDAMAVATMTSQNFGDNRVYQALKSNDVGLKLAQIIYAVCQRLFYMKVRMDLEPLDFSSHPIFVDVSDATAKMCACLSNCVLSDVLPRDQHRKVFVENLQKAHEGGAAYSTRVVLQPVVSDALTSTLVVMAQTNVSLLPHIQHMKLVYETAFAPQMVPNSSLESRCNCIRLINWGFGKVHNESAAFSKQIREITERFRWEMSSTDRDKRHVAFLCEILNAVMDWFGQDDFYPHLFTMVDGNLGATLPQLIQRTLQSLSTFTSSMSPEELETLENAERFLEYKQSMS